MRTLKDATAIIFIDVSKDWKCLFHKESGEYRPSGKSRMDLWKRLYNLRHAARESEVPDVFWSMKNPHYIGDLRPDRHSIVIDDADPGVFGDEMVETFPGAKCFILVGGMFSWCVGQSADKLHDVYGEKAEYIIPESYTDAFLHEGSYLSTMREGIVGLFGFEETKSYKEAHKKEELLTWRIFPEGRDLMIEVAEDWELP